MTKRQGDGWSGDVWGEAPVQGEGLADSKLWYFRARGTAWSFEIADDPLCPDTGLVGSGEPGVEYAGDYDNASYMPDECAWSLIAGCILRYRREGGTARRPDGIGQLYRCLTFRPDALDAWAERWSEGGREPVAAAWAVSSNGSMMEGIVELVADLGLGPGHPQCAQCPPPLRDLRGNHPELHRTAVAEHLRQAVKSLPTLDALRAAMAQDKG